MITNATTYGLYRTDSDDDGRLGSRLMSYLEQSTRYVPYTARPGGRWKYVTPEEIRRPEDLKLYEAVLDKGFEIYTRWMQPVEEHFSRRYPKVATDSAVSTSALWTPPPPPRQEDKCPRNRVWTKPLRGRRRIDPPPLSCPARSSSPHSPS